MATVPPQDQPDQGLRSLELSFPLPRSLYTNLHIHLTFLATSALLFLTTTSEGDSVSTVKGMGSFVYAMPDRTNPKNTISTAFYSAASSIDHASRTARILARKMGMPVYVGCSIDLSELVAEEQMEGMAKIIETVMGKWEEHQKEKAGWHDKD